MGNPKQKWTSEEEEALRAGVAKHGTGKWKNIQRDPEFNPYLFSRSNIDLKDKWRNMSVSATGQGPREKSRMPKAKASSDSPAAQLSTPQTFALPATVAHDASTDPIVDDSARSSAPKYNALIFEALSVLKEPNGSDITAILRYIEQRNEVPQNFRRLLGSRLRRLVAQEKLEKLSRMDILNKREQRRFCLEVVEMKSVSSAFYFNREIQCHFLYFVCFGLLGWDGTLNLFTRYVIILQVQNCFKIKEDNSFETKTPIPKQKDVRPRPSQSSDCINSVDTVEAAAATAASQIAEAENKSYVAAEAVKEAERISSMAEDTYSQLQLLKEIFERCSRGEIVIMA